MHTHKNVLYVQCEEDKRKQIGIENDEEVKS